MDVDAAGRVLGGNTHEIIVEAVGLLCCLDFLNCGLLLVGGHEDDQTLAGIVHLVVDDLLDGLLGLLGYVPGFVFSESGRTSSRNVGI